MQGIFLRSDAGLVLLEPKPYDTEDVLQRALEDFPEVIAGATTTGAGEPRLLLLSREMPVPSSDASGATFSLDHLFVGPDCVPVFVEVKRSSDTRIRREVVGQMLDYAANGVKYWPISLLQSTLSEKAVKQDQSVAELVSELNPELDVDSFWDQVEANLKSGRVRLLFVADALPPELVRVIEFLNEQMSPAEVLGVELRQYVSGDHVAYVPQVLGRTATATTVKTAGGGVQWNQVTFLDAASTRLPQVQLDFVNRLLGHVSEFGCKLSWGRGVTPGVGGWYDVGGKPTGLWALNAGAEAPGTDGWLQFYSLAAGYLTQVGTDVIQHAADHLEVIPSMASKIEEARAGGWKKYPSVSLAEVAGHPVREQAVLDSVMVIVRAPSGASSSRPYPSTAGLAEQPETRA